jgi:3-hydroxybutyryl-CoA dehydrogenase
MGAGIAELALLHDLEVTLVDVAGEMLVSARAGIEERLARQVERGRLEMTVATAALSRLSTSTSLDELASCDVVIEAVSERLELKREIFERLGRICPAQALLATNTSSLRVSAIAAGVRHPERIVGMHFFNPATRMKLVEVIAGLDSEDVHLQRAIALSRLLGKQPIVARDGIGFLVNRIARPFVGEALRLVQEGIATFSQIDRICRMGGGFPMGPFELVDLIGLDVNLEIGESFWFQSYCEPRWRPSPIQAQLVAAGRLGRKSGSGFYSYADKERDADPTPPELGGGDGRLVALGGSGPIADYLSDVAARAGYELCGWLDPAASSAWLAVDAEPCRRLGPGLTRSVEARVALCSSSSLSDRPGQACGFHLLPGQDPATLVEISRTRQTSQASVTRGREFFGSLGLHVEEVGDAPGMVLGRIVSQLVNEAAFALEEGVAGADDIDAGARLGLNYPRGPIEWSDAVGLDHVRAVLCALGRHRGEERYRLSPLLRTAREDLATSSA